ncbi:lasso peptide biosynthesis B2 protein [Erythrobacter sp.]|uniref:lasso peptide biosynthesis B2 protein n=1 Tax=Erythrobacter sp. TaxID=1042 RepID=UPI002EB2AFE3|nr:lasso peptide biosynthesis B2 protein [Erythrobacter sp.]
MQTSQAFKRKGAPGWRDAPWLFAYGVRALASLARARWTFRRVDAQTILARNEAAADRAKAGGEGAISQERARIAFVLPRIARRLPWRSDCLVQAIAAQDWLASHGSAGIIHLGVEKPAGGEFGAHAWLVCDGEVVTGGDIARYELLLGESRDAPGEAGAS